MNQGDYSVTADYEPHLEAVLGYHESESPVAHKKKYELIKGDATRTLGEHMERQPETIVALAYFDLDICEPTRACLDLLLPQLTRGSVLAFDELNCPKFPGETLAMMEVLCLDKYAIRRSPLNPLISYMIVD